MNRQRDILEHMKAADGVSRWYALRCGLLHEAEDIVGHGRVLLCEAVDRYDPARGMSLKSWVRAYVRWYLIGEESERRRRKKRRAVEFWEHDIMEETCVDQAELPDRRAELREMRLALAAAMRALPRSQWRAMVGQYVSDGKPRERAGSGTSARTIRNYTERARRTMRRDEKLAEHV